MLFTSIKANRKVRSLDGTSRAYCSHLYKKLMKSANRYRGLGTAYLGNMDAACNLLKPFLPYCNIYVKAKKISLFHYSHHVSSIRITSYSIIYKRMKVKIGMIRVKYFKEYDPDMR